MNLFELIEEFKRRSGRYDLDEGEIIKWLNLGIRYLDHITDFPKGTGVVQISVNEGDYSLCLQGDYRTIEAVYFVDESGKSPMTRLHIRDFINRFPNIKEVDRGKPQYFATTPRAPEGGYYMDITIAPPSDRAGVVEVLGKIFSIELSRNYIENWWSKYFPFAVIAAALYKYELIQYKNIEGANDYLKEVLNTVTGITYDFIEDDIVNIRRMEG